MKELFKESRLAYQRRGPSESLEPVDPDEAAFAAEVERDSARQRKAFKGAEAPESALYGEGGEEAEEADESAEVSDAIKYAKELMNDVSRVGKIKYELEFEPQKTKFSLYHHIDMFKVYADSKFSDESLNKKMTRVCELIGEVQEEIFNKELKLESEKWQSVIADTKAYQKQVKRYFKKLNKPLNRMSGKGRKKFLLHTAAFLEKGADEHARKFVAEMLT